MNTQFRNVIECEWEQLISERITPILVLAMKQYFAVLTFTECFTLTPNKCCLLTAHMCYISLHCLQTYYFVCLFQNIITDRLKGCFNHIFQDFSQQMCCDRFVNQLYHIINQSVTTHWRICLSRFTNVRQQHIRNILYRLALCYITKVVFSKEAKKGFWKSS